MIVDFFVHPEHPIKTGYRNTQNYQRYIEHLAHLLKESQFPVLIKGLEPGEFDNSFSLNRVLSSASHYIVDFPVDRGEVAQRDWDKFTGLVNLGKEFRVHGSYFGQCTQGFAVQLFGYLHRKEHWNGTADEKERKLQKKLEKMHEWKGDFRSSGIRYGTVIAPESMKIKIRSPSWLFLSPHGNVAHQLIDEKTVIY